ncbi:MAG: dihydrolipoamide acetyltransferase family protein, partial [Planctomycetota bacterium]
APADPTPPPAAPPPAPVPAAPPAAPASAVALRERTLAAPATRKRARELGIDINQVPGSGTNGRVTRQDLEDYIAAGAAAASVAAPSAPPPRVAVAPPPALAEDQRVPLRGLRGKIAEQMVRAKQFSPHFTYADECDMTEVVELRRKAKPLAAERGVKLTYLPFIIKALVACLKKYPSVNALVDDTNNEYILRKDYNIGLATDTDDGLTVVVVKNADRLSIYEIAAEIQRLTEAARAKKIALDDLKGSTITITSAGSIGGFLATPILNYPEVAILGVYRIKERPVVKDGEIVVRHMTNFTITLDHRIVDGATAARFVNDLIRLLETPGLMLLEGA